MKKKRKNLSQIIIKKNFFLVVMTFTNSPVFFFSRSLPFYLKTIWHVKDFCNCMNPYKNHFRGSQLGTISISRHQFWWWWVVTMQQVQDDCITHRWVVVYKVALSDYLNDGQVFMLKNLGEAKLLSKLTRLRKKSVFKTSSGKLLYFFLVQHHCFFG